MGIFEVSFSKFFALLPGKFDILDGISVVKSLFWNANASPVEYIISITSVIPLWEDLVTKICWKIMTATTNADSLR